MSPDEKYSAIKNSFVPGKNFLYPYSTHVKYEKERKCYLSAKHFESFHWLTFSISLNGLFCKYCSLFAKFGGINKSTSLSKFVKVPLNKYSKLLGKDGDLVVHNQHQYHKEAVLLANNFLENYNNPETDIRNKLSLERKNQAIQNRKCLIPIIETIIIMGKQNIPLRGHRDSGVLQEESVINEGNFRELLRFRIASGDTNLKEHLNNPNLKATYISSQTQNEIITCCGQEILNNILGSIYSSAYYSIIFDETTDVSHTSQMSLIIRYIENEEPHENFVAFIDCHQSNFTETVDEPILTGKVLAETVLNFLTKYNFDFKRCVGISTDNCSLMLGEQKGAVTHLQKYLPNALKCPCSSHSLNLSISKCNTVQDVRNAVGIIKEVVSFFNSSAKRNFVLKCKSANLKSLCETRWVDRHDAVILFRTNLLKIAEALTEIQKWKDTESSSKANCLLHAVTSTNFIVSLYCLSELLSFTVNLSRYLQNKRINRLHAQEIILNVISTLKKKRTSCQESFKDLFKAINEICGKLGVNVSMPRVTSRQINRGNPQVTNSEDYYRITVYIPLLENIIDDLNFRFDSNNFVVFNFDMFLPSVLSKKSKVDIKKDIEIFSKYLQGVEGIESSIIFTNLSAELELYAKKYEHYNKDESINIMYGQCNESMFPLSKKFLAICLTLPIGVASAERSFSALRRLKTWLRATITQERLVGLALLHIHRDMKLDVNKIIDIFAQKKTRKLDFIL